MMAMERALTYGKPGGGVGWGVGKKLSLGTPPAGAGETEEEQPSQLRGASWPSYTAPDAQPAVSARTVSASPIIAAPTPPRAARFSSPILEAEYNGRDRRSLSLSITNVISSFDARSCQLSA
jgi:hypothetical protein